MTETFPAFYAALMALGTNDVERARALGISYKSIKRLKQRLPDPIIPFCHAPELLRALADDVESAQKEAE